MNAALEPRVQDYLEALERELKQCKGVSPEEALSDAREFLQNNWESLMRAEPGLEEDDVYAQLVETFGTPEEVAAEYASLSESSLRRLWGHAPAWRICCTKCGRSAPAARAGITRIGAASWHKYTLGFCRACRRLRWLRIIKDQRRCNLTQRLGADKIPEEVRRSMHRPWRVVLLILAVTLPLAALPALSQKDELPEVFQDLPQGWVVQKSIVVPAGQRDAIGRRLGGQLVRLTNTVLAKQGQPIQINTVECASDQAADRVHEALLKGKSNQRLVHRSGRTVFEFVARTPEQVRLALAARYELGIQPRRVTYRVSFEAAPLESSDDMSWNRMFNLFLELLDRGDSPATLGRIEELAQGFEFGEQLALRRYGQGNYASKWSFAPKPAESSTTGGGELDLYRFKDLPQRAGVPFVSVIGQITSETHALTPTARPATERLIAVTPHWPADDPAIRALAAQVTAGCETPREKVAALLLWLSPGRNVNFGGDVVGSRWGVRKVIEQRFGHCWDFSDVFVTLCRASGVPSRQVLGWIHGAEGHVWAEVLIEGEGWRAVDPTAGGGCGSDYVPLMTSEDGQVPLLYVSAVRIEVASTSSGRGESE